MATNTKLIILEKNVHSVVAVFPQYAVQFIFHKTGKLKRETNQFTFKREIKPAHFLKGDKSAQFHKRESLSFHKENSLCFFFSLCLFISPSDARAFVCVCVCVCVRARVC